MTDDTAAQRLRASAEQLERAGARLAELRLDTRADDYPKLIEQEKQFRDATSAATDALSGMSSFIRNALST